MRSKYVTGIYRDTTDRRQFVDTHVAVVFPDKIMHSDMRMIFMKIISAGFVNVEATREGDIKVVCHGRSESLNKDSMPGDAKLVEIALSNPNS